MEKQSRRKFLKTSIAAGTAIAGLASKPIRADSNFGQTKKSNGVLIDTTACIGCRRCEWACKSSNNMNPGFIETYDDKTIFKKKRRPDDKFLTVVNNHSNGEEHSSFVKVQCMHCNRPACVSACIVGAFTKNDNGAVTWDGNKCIGCRYCMIACPFQIPAFEYEVALKPDIKKCDFCFDRTIKGKLPACSEVCPTEAITFGNREELIRAANEKIKNYPERYQKHIYGEYEVGGTSWLYLTSVEFEKLDFPKLGTDPAPGVSEAIQHGIFAYFIPPIALFALLGGVMWLNNRRTNSDSDKEF